MVYFNIDHPYVGNQTVNVYLGELIYLDGVGGFKIWW